ncbi:MAG: c-type cytochrome [Gammaproteobacteria bacterium]|nr:c-type cytochrome [Gammaproteobacteria bacterium]
MARPLRYLAILALWTAGAGAPAQESLEAGKDFFRAECIACHAIGCNRSGPKLGGIIGRKAGGVPDFADYTEEIKRSGIVWSDETLDEYLKDPDAMVPGTMMALGGSIADPIARRNVIAYMKSGDTSLDLCF